MGGNRPARQNGLDKKIAGMGADPVARIRFYLHKEFRAGKIQLGAMLMKMAGFIKDNALRAFDDC